MKKITELIYGKIIDTSLRFKFIAYNRRRLFVGLNNKGKYAILNRTSISLKAIIGDFCLVRQGVNEDNIPIKEPTFTIKNTTTKELEGLEKFFAEKLLERRML